MIAVMILEDHDVIEATDWVRQLQMEFDGQSDTLMTVSTYGGSRINRLGWITAEESIPYWVGKTVGEYHAGLSKLHHAYSACEFIRGPIPESHKEQH